MPARRDEPSQARQMAPSGSQQPSPGRRMSKWRPGSTWGQSWQALSLVGEESPVEGAPCSRCPYRAGRVYLDTLLETYRVSRSVMGTIGESGWVSR